jgi:predicted nucleic acid-binding protein
MRIYLDNCCFSRPFDEDAQDRIVLEADAILLILERVRAGRLTLVASDVLVEECALDPDEKRRRQAGTLLALSSERIELDTGDEQRAEEMQSLGFGMTDSFHVVAAEKGRCDVLLTTDDNLIRKAQRHQRMLRVRVVNPIDWLRQVTE